MTWQESDLLWRARQAVFPSPRPPVKGPFTSGASDPVGATALATNKSSFNILGAILLKSFFWGIGGALLGLLPGFLHLQEIKPPNTFEQWTASVERWFHGLWLVDFISGLTITERFLLGTVLSLVLIFVASTLQERKIIKNEELEGIVFPILGMLTIISVLLAVFSGLSWIYDWISQSISNQIPVLPETGKSLANWLDSHRLDGPSGFVALWGIGSFWYLVASGFSRRAQFTENELFAGTSFVAAIIQIPLTSLAAVYLVFGFPLTIMTQGALLTGFIAITIGIFFHTVIHLLGKDHGPLLTSASPGPFTLRLLILSAESILIAVALFVGISQLIGTNRVIYANRDWQSAGLSGSKGDLVLIVNTFGSWTADPYNSDLPRVGGQGYPRFSYETDWAKYTFAPFGSLVLKNGITRPAIYAVGRINIITVSSAATLYLRMNDNYLGDNVGSLNVWTLNITDLFE